MRQRSMICLSVASLVLGLCCPSASAEPGKPMDKDGGGVASWLLGRAQQNLIDGRDNLMGRMSGGLVTAYEVLRDCYEGPASCAADPADSPDSIYLAAATDDFRGVLDLPGFEQSAREGLGEAVCWRLKGQALVGNDELVEAFGRRYEDPPPSLEQERDEFQDAIDGYHGGTDLFAELIDCPECFDADACLEGTGLDCYCTGYAARGMLVDLLARKANARSEKADRLFALGMESLSRKAEAEEEIRRAVQEGYLGAAVLAAGMEESQIALANMSRLQAGVMRLKKTFERIASGLDAAGFHNDYVPFLPYHDCNPDRSLRDIADRASGYDPGYNGAAYWEQEAKAAQRDCDIDATKLLYALQDIRQGVKGDLDDLCGYMTDAYFPGGQFLDDPEVVQAFLEACLDGPSELQRAVLANEEAYAAFETAFTELQNVPEKIRIEEERVGQIATVRTETGRAIGACEIAIGWANAFSFSATVDFFPPNFGVTVNFNPGSIVEGYKNAEITMLEAMQEVRIEGIDSAATIKLYLLEMAERAKALREYELRIAQSGSNVENLTNQARALADEWRRSLDDLVDAYFSDPAYRLEMEEAVRRAHLSLRSAQRWSYLAARALSYDWSLRFAGTNDVVVVLGNCNVLGSSRSVFSLNSALAARDYWICLGYWATENFSTYGPMEDETATEISVRKDVLGFKDYNFCVGQTYPADIQQENIRLFKEFIQDHTAGSLITFEFATSIADESLFPIYISEGVNFWNAKLSEIACNFVGSDDLNPGGATNGRLGLTLGGMSAVRQPDAAWGPPGDACLGDPDDASGDLMVHYDLEDFGASPSLRTVSIDAHLNGFPPEPDFSAGLARLSVGAQRWQVTISKGANPNNLLNWDELEDIELKVKWRYGQPPDYDCSIAESDPGAVDWELEE